jgi:hypothetical protein
METKRAKITRTETKTTLVLEGADQSFEVVLTDDNPNNVKTAFNGLLKELKKGLFKYELEDDIDDLYCHICNEYITQLNVELETVHNELKDYNLLEVTASEQNENEN